MQFDDLVLAIFRTVRPQVWRRALQVFEEAFLLGARNNLNEGPLRKMSFSSTTGIDSIGSRQGLSWWGWHPGARTLCAMSPEPRKNRQKNSKAASEQ
jgi:hypothetical protein